VQLTEGPIENKTKKQRIEQEEQKDMQEMGKKEACELRTFGPKKPVGRTLSAWAWRTGSAEELQGY
jgi:hypothetical protein